MSSIPKTAYLIFTISLLACCGMIYFLERKTSQEIKTNGVYANPDGSVKQVEDYITQNLLSNPDSFTPIHWSKLQKRDVFGNISYTIGVIYKAKNDKNEMVMNSKVFELDESGLILLVLDSGPMNTR